MKIIKAIVVATIVTLPLFASGVSAQAATANQYSARGHGRQPMMSNQPSRAIYHRQHRHMRHRGY